MLGGMHPPKTDGSARAAESMFRFWDRFMDQCEVETAKGEKDCREVSLFVDHAVNPYTQEKFRGTPGFEFIGKYEGTHK
jgi:hypothetical protein